MRRLRRHNPLTSLGTALFAALHAPLCLAGLDIEEQRAVAADASILIDCPRGEIEIRGWTRNELSIEGELDDLADGLHLDTAGERVEVRVKLPTNKPSYGDGSQFVIRVPHGASLDVIAASTDVVVSGVRGRLAVRTLSGDVAVSDAGSITRINTVGGSIDVEGADGRLMVVSVDGDAAIDSTADLVVVDTVGGEFDLDLGAFSRLIASVNTGELDIRGTLTASGAIDASSVNGEVHLRLNAPLNARVHMRSGTGGEIDNELNDDEAEDLPGRRVLRTTVGDGSAEINMVTVNGEISIEQVE